MRISHELPGCNWLEEKIKKAKVAKAANNGATAAGAGSNGAPVPVSSGGGSGDGQKVKNSTKRKEDSQPTQPLKSKSDGGGR